MKSSLTLNPAAFLVVSTTLGFFALLALLIFVTIPESSSDILQVMLGVVGTAWGTIVGYHFGSSSGSTAKSETIAALTGTGDGNSNGNTVKTDSTTKTETVKTVSSEQPPTP